MARKLFYVLFLFLSSAVYGGGLEVGARADARSAFNSNFPGITGQDNKFNSIATNIFISASYTAGSLGADALGAGTQYYYVDASGSDNNFDAEIYKLNAFLRGEIFNITAGRQFYGNMNTLLPYYGLMDNFFGVPAASLDGVNVDVYPAPWLRFNFLAAKESDTYFTPARGVLYGALISARFAGVELAPFAYNLTYNDSPAQIDYNTWLYGAYADWALTPASNIYFSYAQNSIKDSYPGLEQKKDGGAWLFKINSEVETKHIFYSLRFLALRSDGRELWKGDTYRGVHPYVNLGSIFTGSNLMGVVPASSSLSARTPGGINNLTAYNIGATLSPKGAKFIKFDFDIYSYSETENLALQDKNIGSELDLGLTLTPLKNLDLTLIYAKFFPAAAFTGQFPAPIYESGDVSQLAFKLNYSFN